MSVTPPTDPSEGSEPAPEGVSPEAQPERVSPEPEPEPEPEPAPPLLRILTPGATDEEVAALVAVISAMGAAGTKPAPPVSEWAANHRRVRATYSHGFGGWRSSGMP